METFTHTVTGGATVTGRYHIPALLPAPAVGAKTSRALVVALHGGSYSSLYFDVDANHTASIASDALSIPVVALNRPGYDGSTFPDSAPEDGNYAELYADWLHTAALPAVWDKFGAPNECTAVVLLCHSLASTGAVTAAATYADAAPEQRRYPLAGLIMSGWGSILDKPPPSIDLFTAVASRDALMLPPGTADPAIYAHTERLMRPLPPTEMTAMAAWLPRWRTEWAPRVRVPVMLGMADKDALWPGTDEHVRDWIAAFSGSPRVEGSVLRGAPHNLEMSLWSRGWYARCFGFAYECAVSA
ncbi:hypothetical protein GQ53DRAFT_742224 [Thozetella sp. PMI_491]|nr:hypothetical protein GQ53DRAFT_742224 [Thozetella sp. PMI_491]